MIDSWLWMDWIMVWNPFNLRCSLPIGSFSPVWPQTGFLCRGVTLSSLSSALCCRLHSSSSSSGNPSLSIHLLLQAVSQSEMSAITKTSLISLIRPSPSSHTHRYKNTSLGSRALLPTSGSLERCCCSGRASPRQPWCGRAHLWATKHIYLQSARHAGSGPPQSVLLDERHI